jgi:hypothetical protein
MALRSLERFGSALLLRAKNRGFRAREARPPGNDAPVPKAVAVDRDRRARLVLTIATAVIIVSLGVFVFA